MKNSCSWITGVLIVFIFAACSKKSHPSPVGKVNDSTLVKKAVVKIKTPVPKIIIVNDSSAHKTFDGRLYYDLGGKRYWRNNKDGKYYLYSKSMQNNEDFKGRTD